MKEKLLTIILFLIFMLPVGMADNIFMPSNSLPYNIFKTVKLPYASHSTTTVFQDRKGMIWIGTYHGICRYDGYKTTLYMTDSTRLPKENVIMSIAQLDDNHLIVGTLGGLSYLNITNGQSEPVSKPLNRIKSVRTMLVHGDELWIGTMAEGLWKYNLKTKKLQQIVSSGIRLVSICALCPVGKTMYVGSIDGLFAVNMTDNHIRRISLPTTHKYIISLLWHPQAQSLLVGMEGQMCLYRPQQDKAEVSNILSGSVCKFQLKSREYITFELSTLQYAPHQEVTFYYKLGDDDAWQSLKEGSNELAFAHISGGTYKLSLCSTNPAVDKNAKISTYYIIIPSPWYACTTAIFIYILIAIAVIIFIFVWYRRRSLAVMERHEKERSMELLRQENEFFINMSHELKTPLSLIIAPLSTLIRATQQNAALQKSLTGIQKNALQLNQLIHKVLEFKNDDFKDDNSMIRSHIDMNSLVRNCLESFASIAVERNIQLNFHSANQEIWMNMDTLKIQSAITNLISNAIRFVKNNTGIIDVTVRQEENQVLIGIEDNGRGISEKDAKMIFVRFYQGDNQSPNNEGSGIGLSLVKKYIEMHGGKVELTSGKTTLFTISLPLDGENAITNEPVDEERDLDPDKYTIIIVDDNREIVSVLRDALSEQYNCIAAFDGKDGLEKIAKYHPSLIIADQMMPVMNGFQLVRALKHQPATANIPILMLTAKDDQNTEMQSIKLGVDIFLAKPFSLDKILLQVARLIDKKMALEKEARIAAIGSPQFEITSKPEDLDEKFMEKLTAMIEENMEDEDFNVTLLADKLGYNQKLLYRKMKQITGMTPIAYIKKIRMKKAAFLMKDPRYTVTEIMYMVGYSNMLYFIKCFQAEFGMTPKKFLEK